MNRGPPFTVAQMLTWNPVGTYSTCPAIGMLSMPGGGVIGAAGRSVWHAAAKSAATSTVSLLSSIRHPPNLARVIIGDEQGAVRQHQEPHRPSPPARHRCR